MKTSAILMLSSALSVLNGEDLPPVSEPTPTVEEGMPLFSSDEIGDLFVTFEPAVKKEHPIFVGMEDDIVELETFNVYSDELTLRQSLAERLSDPAWQAMIGRLDELDPDLSAVADYDRRSSDRFFSSQTPGGAADRPDPGGIDFRTALDASLKAFNAVFGP
jgi:hypothetical protein